MNILKSSLFITIITSTASLAASASGIEEMCSKTSDPELCVYGQILLIKDIQRMEEKEKFDLTPEGKKLLEKEKKERELYELKQANERKARLEQQQKAEMEANNRIAVEREFQQIILEFNEMKSSHFALEREYKNKIEDLENCKGKYQMQLANADSWPTYEIARTEQMCTEYVNRIAAIPGEDQQLIQKINEKARVAREFANANSIKISD